MKLLNNFKKNSEKPALHEKFELIQSVVNGQNYSFSCVIMKQTMNKNASEAITIQNLATIIFLQKSIVCHTIYNSSPFP